MKTLKTTLGVVIATVAVALGAAAPAYADEIPDCQGTYDPTVVCKAGTLTAGFYSTPYACDVNGRYYVNTVSMETSQGIVGWYTWECDQVGDVWRLNLRGFVYK